MKYRITVHLVQGISEVYSVDDTFTINTDGRFTMVESSDRVGEWKSNTFDGFYKEDIRKIEIEVI